MTNRAWGNCGECLMRDVEIIALDEHGKCPRCGADYGQLEPCDRALKTGPFAGRRCTLPKGHAGPCKPDLKGGAR